jgi:hypothetical protein
MSKFSYKNYCEFIPTNVYKNIYNCKFTSVIFVDTKVNLQLL